MITALSGLIISKWTFNLITCSLINCKNWRYADSHFLEMEGKCLIQQALATTSWSDAYELKWCTNLCCLNDKFALTVLPWVWGCIEGLNCDVDEGLLVRSGRWWLAISHVVLNACCLCGVCVCVFVVASSHLGSACEGFWQSFKYLVLLLKLL